MGYGFSLAIPFGTSWSVPSPQCCPFLLSQKTCANMRPMERTFDWARACGWNSGPYHARDCSSVPFPGCSTPIPPQGDPVGKMDDVGLAKAAAKFLVKEACVDEANVFALGFSAGSMMSNRIACEAGQVFRGVVAISGLLDPVVRLGCSFLPHLPWQRPLNYIMFCGTSDPICMVAASSTFEMWREKNECSKDVK